MPLTPEQQATFDELTKLASMPTPPPPPKGKVLTPDEETDEIKKCRDDVVYFIENYCFIDGDKTKPFKLFAYQREFIKTVLKNKFVIVNKGRQLGVSQVSGALVLWFAMFKKSKEIVIISINDKEAQYFKTKRCEQVFESIPSWLGGKLKEQNAHQMKFDTGSIIEAIANTTRALRGRSPNFVIMDEFAFFGTGEKISTTKRSLLTSALPSLQISGEHIVLISTPNGTAGVGAEFFHLWEGSRAKENDWTPFEIHWYECPFYNNDAPNYADWEKNEWAVKQSKQYADLSSFRQEILGEWIMSGDTVIPQEHLDRLLSVQPLRTDFLKPGVHCTPDDAMTFKDGWNKDFQYIKGFWVWNEPEPGHYYILGEDISTGRAGDFSTINVTDINTGEQVAEWRNRVPHSFVYPITLAIAEYYNNAFVVVETNSTEEVVNKLLEGGYDNVYHREHGIGKRLVPGWYTDTRTRPLLVSDLQDIIINSKVKVKSGRLITELKTFVWEGGKAQAAKGSNDDLVFGFMISDFITESYVNQQSIGINIKRFADKAVDVNTIPIPMLDNQEIETDANNMISSVDLKDRELHEISQQELEDNYEVDYTNAQFLGVFGPRKK